MRSRFHVFKVPLKRGPFSRLLDLRISRLQRFNIVHVFGQWHCNSTILGGKRIIRYVKRVRDALFWLDIASCLRVCRKRHTNKRSVVRFWNRRCFVILCRLKRFYRNRFFVVRRPRQRFCAGHRVAVRFARCFQLQRLVRIFRLIFLACTRFFRRANHAAFYVDDVLFPT